MTAMDRNIMLPSSEYCAFFTALYGDKKSAATTSFPFASSFEQFLEDTSFIGHIHYSWFLPILAAFSTTDAQTLASIFPIETYKKIATHQSLPEEKISLHPLIAEYVHTTLMEKLTSTDPVYIPRFLISEHPLNKLLTISKQQLVRVIDYLGLYDLAPEIPRMIHAPQLKHLQAILSKDMILFLRNAIAEKQRLTFASIELSKWNGDEDLLKKVIHERGLNRIAKAIAGMPLANIWHITHSMDIGRGRFVAHESHLLHDPKAQAYLEHQLLECINHILELEVL